MNVYELVFAIVLVVTIGQVIRNRRGRGHDGRHAEERAQRSEGRAAAERVQALEKRVEVLERIVTDQGYELRQKFRDLE